MIAPEGPCVSGYDYTGQDVELVMDYLLFGVGLLIKALMWRSSLLFLYITCTYDD
jgi:hypothetical protein